MISIFALGSLLVWWALGSSVASQSAELQRVYRLPADLADGIAREAGALGVPARWLADLIAFESDGFRAAAVNPVSGASGLIQFMPATARELGTTVEAIRRLSAVEQLPLVRAYFELPRIRQYGPLRSRLDLYMSVFYPAAIGKGEGYRFPARVREANPGIDTAGDYAAYVNRRADRWTTAT